MAFEIPSSNMETRIMAAPMDASSICAEFGRTCSFLEWRGVAPADIEDVAQQTFVVALRRMREVPHVDNPRAWLRGIASRVARQYFRWHRVRKRGGLAVEQLYDSHSAWQHTPELDAAAAEATELVRSTLRSLSPRLQEVLVLTELEQRPATEVASILSVPVGTVQSRRFVARVQLRSRLEKRLGGCDLPMMEPRTGSA
jgi:RNA polymerase sigma-70 factor (ECF subfamily)